MIASSRSTITVTSFTTATVRTTSTSTPISSIHRIMPSSASSTRRQPAFSIEQNVAAPSTFSRTIDSRRFMVASDFVRGGGGGDGNAGNNNGSGSTVSLGIDEWSGYGSGGILVAPSPEIQSVCLFTFLYVVFILRNIFSQYYNFSTTLPIICYT